MSESFICKIASLAEMNTKWDYEIARSGEDRENWIVWKKRNMEKYRRGDILPYYGILEGRIIWEATAMLHPDIVQNSAGLVDRHTVSLSADLSHRKKPLSSSVFRRGAFLFWLTAPRWFPSRTWRGCAVPGRIWREGRKMR